MQEGATEAGTMDELQREPIETRRCSRGSGRRASAVDGLIMFLAILFGVLLGIGCSYAIVWWLLRDFTID
jgi:hypothetical protein